MAWDPQQYLAFAAPLFLGRFGRNGSFEKEFLTPWGVAADSKGRLIVADTGNRRLVELTL